jgi:hypothetical protein
MARNDSNVTMEGVHLIFRNFSGKAGMYNKEGDRNFCIVLDRDVAEQMAKDGWNVKFPVARSEDEDARDPFLKVVVKYRNMQGEEVKPPRVVMITSRGRTNLGEDDVNVLDWVDMKNVDLIIRPFEWSVNGKTGTNAYLQSIYVTIEEDELELKYADVEDVHHDSE